MQMEHQNFFCRNFSNQRTCVSNSRVLTLTQTDISLEYSGQYGAHCANEYGKKKKEKKKTTNLAIYYGTSLATMAIILWNDIFL